MISSRAGQRRTAVVAASVAVLAAVCALLFTHAKHVDGGKAPGAPSLSAAAFSGDGVWDDSPGSEPSCHKSKDKDGPMPAPRAAAADAWQLTLTCQAPASQDASSDAHATPPVRGPTPIPPPSPVSLSVLRV
ncbi:hypothetical protein [Streptomyces sp. HNM0574]|uniref:hypothetical protein n=1 Tax=Streptomyces sp. HNM0574 TaxID=2714954 RepID=UPI00146A1502|nr:hypothetical protein [Streptomyces sp. HNM0574]NLU68491.1 hypothetical protein [Streptomyces sp. HNM0574]